MEEALLQAGVGAQHFYLSGKGEIKSLRRGWDPVSTVAVPNSNPKEMKGLFPPEEMRGAERHKSGF